MCVGDMLESLGIRHSLSSSGEERERGVDAVTSVPEKGLPSHWTLFAYKSNAIHKSLVFTLVSIKT